MRTVSAQAEASLLRERMLASLASAFGALATSLAAVGIYALIAFNVTRKMREIGVRVALGAGRRAVVWLVMREVLWLLADRRGRRRPHRLGLCDARRVAVLRRCRRPIRPRRLARWRCSRRSPSSPRISPPEGRYASIRFRSSALNKIEGSQGLRVARSQVQVARCGSSALAPRYRLTFDLQTLRPSTLTLRPCDPEPCNPATLNPATLRPSEASQASSTSRTLRASATGVSGFCRKATPESSTPWCRIASSV